MIYDTKTTVIDLRKLSFWQRLKAGSLLLVRGGFQINGPVETKVTP